MDRHFFTKLAIRVQFTFGDANKVRALILENGEMENFSQDAT